VTSAIPDYFSLFGLPSAFAIDQESLRQAYERVMVLVHPDRHTQAPAADRRAAMQMASLVNEAWHVLRSDVARASYLCRQAGVDVDGHGAARLSPAFLEEQWALREALERAIDKEDHEAIQALRIQAAQRRAAICSSLGQLIDVQHDFRSAAEQTRILMFLDKFQSELPQALGEGETL
jgi:molecular chaperone HscB